MTNIENETKSIIERFKNAGIELRQDEVSDRLQLLVEKFKVPPGEAARSVVNYFRKEHNISFEGVRAGGSAPEMDIADIQGDNQWCSVTAKVVQLWESTSDKIFQTGILGDGTGTIKFTIFKKSGFSQPLEEGKVYRFENAVSSVWNDTTSLKFNKNTKMEGLDQDIEVKQRTETIEGVVVSIGQGSGLIKRCPECKRRIIKGSCQEHGVVTGVFDLRTKAILEVKDTTYDLILNADATEELTGINLYKAKKMATEMMDAEVVAEKIKEIMLGRYYSVEGIKMPNIFLVHSMTPLEPEVAKAKTLLQIVHAVEAQVTQGAAGGN